MSHLTDAISHAWHRILPPMATIAAERHAAARRKWLRARDYQDIAWGELCDTHPAEADIRRDIDNTSAWMWHIHDQHTAGGEDE